MFLLQKLGNILEPVQHLRILQQLPGDLFQQIGGGGVDLPLFWQAELYSYDDEGRIADKWTWTGDNSEWDTHLVYEYNRQGDVTLLQVTVGTETLYQHYEYNPLGLLAAVYVSTNGTQPSTPEVSYTYKPEFDSK